MRKQPWAAVVALTIVIAGAFAGPARATDSTVDLSSKQAVEAYLQSIGVDPSTAVYQEGSRNYAGPNCPGDGWSCISDLSRPIVQLLFGDGENVVDCSGTVSGTGCVVVQSSTTASNTARCVISSTANPVTQTCSITQSSGSGANTATVDQSALQRGGETQLARQRATVHQQSNEGANTLNLTQLVQQSAAVTSVGDVSQQQDAFQDATIDQFSGSGDQVVSASQLQRVDAHVSTSGSITQKQNTLDLGPNTDIEIDQRSTSGDNEADVNQDMRLAQDASSVFGSATQLQGSPDGGLSADVDPDSEFGFSNYDANQNKTWTITRDVPGESVALQDDDVRCCIFGEIPATPDTCAIVQSADLTAPAGTPQSIYLQGRAYAKQSCTLTQTATRNGETETNTQTGTRIDDEVICDFDEACVQEENPFSAEAHFAARNESDGQQFESDDAASPRFISAAPDEIVELKITFHNHDPKPVSEIRLIGPVPAEVQFLSCNACVGGVPSNGVVTFNRGIGDAGGQRSGTYRVRIIAPSGTKIVLQATATSSAGNELSNKIRINVE